MKPLSLKTVAGLCAAASVAVVACAAVAQDGPPSGDGPGPRGGFRGEDPAQRAQQLHDLLQITPAQEPSFRAWQAALQPKGRPERPGREMRDMTTPQRLDMALAEQTERDAELRTHVIATKAFYNGLTPAQQKTMDTLPPQGLLAMEGGGGRFGGRGGPGGRRGQGGNGGFDGQQGADSPPPQ
jgi:Spy/CpxP family protein refolding chaperone